MAGTPASVFATVVFLRIPEFARRPATEQTRLRAQLESALAVAIADMGEASRIVLDAADGIVLAVLGDPRAALRVTQRTLAAGAAGLPLGAGVTHGAVRPAAENGGGLLGDGIAVAAGISALAGPSRILLTKEFRDALADAAPGAEAPLVRAGTHTDASLRAHQLYHNDPREARARGRRYVLAGAFLVLGLIGAGVGYRVSLEGAQGFADRVSATLRAGAHALAQRLAR
jgi:class 3 adenylate cyclase